MKPGTALVDTERTTADKQKAFLAISFVALAAKGFDIPPSETGSTDGAAAAFVHGCRISSVTVGVLSVAALALAWRIGPQLLPIGER